MIQLTKEQIAKVARVVTGADYIVHSSGHIIDKADLEYPWHPHTTDPIGRSQALAIVEWLADKAASGGRHSANSHTISWRIADLVRERNINGLMAMVIELGEL